MNLERYQYRISEDLLDYEFYSEGPNGRIKKIVRFAFVELSYGSYYNLCFGDWYDEENHIDDISVTNNRDTEKILNTIATIVIDFSNKKPNVLIYAAGSTDSRTRLYQININKYKNAITRIFDIYGVKSNNELEFFNSGINYSAFVVKRKLL